eukprot:TRINITY_DN1297_c1_g1_i1.p1 TRINITY_DN1297_c1_g1~~TRINITY_DN1297_c1_g1_i1.p1  ORF type:complete len:141 (+),score=18.40 TRINITY_DN1297_c1_g1_i1:63-425(+)
MVNRCNAVVVSPRKSSDVVAICVSGDAAVSEVIEAAFEYRHRITVEEDSVWDELMRQHKCGAFKAYLNGYSMPKAVRPRSAESTVLSLASSVSSLDVFSEPDNARLPGESSLAYIRRLSQ